jgi:acyl carrier protein
MSNAATNSAVDVAAVREVVAGHLGVPVDVATLTDDRDLYAAGLTSLATVGLMLALEDRFEVEFPENLLSRNTFRSIASIADAVGTLVK